MVFITIVPDCERLLLDQVLSLDLSLLEIGAEDFKLRVIKRAALFDQLRVYIELLVVPLGLVTVLVVLERTLLALVLCFGPDGFGERREVCTLFE